MYFTNLDFPEMAGVPFPFLNATFCGKSVVWGRELINLTSGNDKWYSYVDSVDYGIWPVLMYGNGNLPIPDAPCMDLFTYIRLKIATFEGKCR